MCHCILNSLHQCNPVGQQHPYPVPLMFDEKCAVYLRKAVHKYTQGFCCCGELVLELTLGLLHHIIIIIYMTSIALKSSGGGASSEAQQNKIINHIQESGTYRGHLQFNCIHYLWREPVDGLSGFRTERP